jgi:PAS domain-containing protein
VPSSPYLLTIPRSDRAFHELVVRLARREGLADPTTFQARLVRLFPAVVVRSRELSSEHPAWYVYRDGRWTPPEASPWWAEGDAATIAIAPDGWVIAADLAARRLLGIDPDVELGVEPRHYASLVAPTDRDDVADLLGVLTEGHTVTASLHLHRDGDGDGEVCCELHAWSDGATIVATLRPSP